MMSNVAFGIAAASFRATATGIMRSASPHTIAVGAEIVASDYASVLFSGDAIPRTCAAIDSRPSAQSNGRK